MKRIAKYAIMGLLSLGIIGCEKRMLSMVEERPIREHLEYLSIDSLGKEHYTPKERRILDKASYRFSGYIRNADDGTLVMDRTSSELNMSQNLFDYNLLVINGYNDLLLNGCIKEPVMAYPRIIRTKSGNYEDSGTGTRGGTPVRDAAAQVIVALFSDMMCTTAGHLFYMWYFDNRSTDYILSTYEWNNASSVAVSHVGNNYQNNMTPISGENYYANLVSYSISSETDLYLSYKDATVFFNSNGSPVGFKDGYEFRAAHRNPLEEAACEMMCELGDENGYNIYYGIHD